MEAEDEHILIKMCRVAAPHLTSPRLLLLFVVGPRAASRAMMPPDNTDTVGKGRLLLDPPRYVAITLHGTSDGILYTHIHATHTYIHADIHTFQSEADLPVVEQSCVLPSPCFANERYASFLSAFLSR